MHSLHGAITENYQHARLKH